ncbi:MAG: 23S rRNA (uracil(1939)-C(5))-methyltransferase RlmD [Clostridia bacterium]|nr:23S rRNA (uracil(1939)-C(5))-methyltransferase RlmD [Clostridia bacterium]
MAGLKKNDNLELHVEMLLGNGNGLCRLDDGFVVFVPSAAPGDVIKAHVIKVTKSYAVAKILEIIQPSPYRNEDGCPFSKSCGGCTFQHISYEKECEFKENTVNDALERIGKLSLRVEKFYGAENVCSYRNKAVYPVGVNKDGKAISGFYAPMSHRIAEHDKCMISNPEFAKIRDCVIEFINARGISVYNEENGKGLVRSIHLRSVKSGNVSLSLILNGDALLSKATEDAFVKEITKSFPFIKTILINVNTKNTNVILGNSWRTLYGDGFIYDELLGRRFRITPASFWQVNREQAEVLYSVAKEYADIKEGESLVDLYCGTGSVGLCLADKGTRLYGVEVVEEAAKDAQFNANLNGIDGKFIAIETENALDDEYVKNLHPDVITVDPPRKGCVGAVEKIAALGAKRIVYISCDPATLARDLNEFETLGYKAVRASAVDMFPRTGHVESVVLLEQADSAI